MVGEDNKLATPLSILHVARCMEGIDVDEGVSWPHGCQLRILELFSNRFSLHHGLFMRPYRLPSGFLRQTLCF
jgi:hypothetical protein